MNAFVLKACKALPPLILTAAVLSLLPLAAFAGPDEELITAVTKKDLAAVKAALAEGAHSDAVDKKRNSALQLAAAGGDVAIVQALLDAHAPADSRSDPSYLTPLLISTMRGHTDVAKLLLAAGADRNATDKSGATLLMAAAASGSVELIDLLLALGVDINAKRKEGGETALDFALGHYQWAVVGRLFDKGATLDATKAGRPGILDLLLAHEARPVPDNPLVMDETVPEADVDLFKKTLALGAPADAVDKEGNTWLMRAAKLHHVAGVTAALAAGNAVNAHDRATGDTPLQLDARQTVQEGGREMLFMIATTPPGDKKNVLEPGAPWPFPPVLDSSKSPWTAHRLQIARLLIAAGADVNAANKYGCAALYDAASTGDPELVSILLQAGAKVEGSGKCRYTPLAVAAEKGRVDAIKVLLAAHANPKVKNFDGLTPLDFARKATRDRQQTVQLVENALKQEDEKQ